MSQDVREQTGLDVASSTELQQNSALETATGPDPSAVKPQQSLPPKVTGRAIVITSGKGGVGKTTVTANLGTALADAGKRVVVVDADVGLRNLDVVMGLENRVRNHSLDVIEEHCTLDEALVRDRMRKSLSLLPAAQDRDKDEMPLDSMQRLLQGRQAPFVFFFLVSAGGHRTGLF